MVDVRAYRSASEFTAGLRQPLPRCIFGNRNHGSGIINLTDGWTVWLYPKFDERLAIPVGNEAYPKAERMSAPPSRWRLDATIAARRHSGKNGKSLHLGIAQTWPCQEATHASFGIEYLLDEGW